MEDIDAVELSWFEDTILGLFLKHKHCRIQHMIADVPR